MSKTRKLAAPTLMSRLRQEGRELGQNCREVADRALLRDCLELRRLTMTKSVFENLPTHHCWGIDDVNPDMAIHILQTLGRPELDKAGKLRLSPGQRRAAIRAHENSGIINTPVTLSPDGRIIKGEEKLHAIIMFNSTARVAFLFGVDVLHEKLYVNGHKRRSSSDDVSVRAPQSSVHAATIARAVKIVMRFAHGRMGATARSSRLDIVDFCDCHPEIYQLAEIADRLFRENQQRDKELRLSRAMYLAILFLLGRVDQELAEGILSRLTVWPDREWQNVASLQNALHRDAAFFKGQSVDYKTVYLFVLTFNALRRGEAMRSLSLANVAEWRLDNGRPDATDATVYREVFPAIDGWTEAHNLHWRSEDVLPREPAGTEKLKMYVSMNWSNESSRELLACCNQNNRRVSSNRAQKYAMDMALGHFALCSVIALCADGRMSDGQHRMLASLLEGVSFPTFILDGVDDRAFAVTDDEETATFKDHLRDRYPEISRDNSRVLAAAVPYMADILIGAERAVARRDMPMSQKDEFFEVFIAPRARAGNSLTRYATGKAWSDLCHHRNGLGLCRSLLVAVTFWGLTSGIEDAEQKTEDFFTVLMGRKTRSDGTRILPRRSQNSLRPSETNNAARSLNEAIRTYRTVVDDGRGNVRIPRLDVITFQRPLLIAALRAWLFEETLDEDWVEVVRKNGLPAVLEAWPHPMQHRRIDPTRSCDFVTVVPVNQAGQSLAA